MKAFRATIHKYGFCLTDEGKALMSPQAREDGVVVQDLDGGAVVYDLHRHKVHNLNQTAALVWRHCDGTRTVSEIARSASSPGCPSVDEQVVWLALRQLEKAHLLQGKLPASSVMSRRELASKLRLVGGIALLPAVTSVLAPTAAQAASCLGTGAVCSANADCCSNLCTNSIPRVCS